MPKLMSHQKQACSWPKRQWEMLSEGKQVQAADLQSQDILSAIVSHFEDAGLETGLRGAPLQRFLHLELDQQGHLGSALHGLPTLRHQGYDSRLWVGGQVQILSHSRSMHVSYSTTSCKVAL